jgi:hypothetical protein
MNVKKTLKNLIRGWFPQEPKLLGKYVQNSPNYEKKQLLLVSIVVLFIGALLIGLPLINVTRPYNFAVDVPKSEILLSESFIVPPSTVTQHTISLNAGDSVQIIGGVNIVNLSRSVDDVIDFSVNDGSHSYFSYNKISVFPSWGVHPLELNVTKSQNYNFVYDNSFSSTSKNVTVQLTNYGREIENHEVPWNRPLIPFGFIFAGVALAIVGIGLMVFGVAKRKAPKTSCLQLLKESKICV